MEDIVKANMNENEARQILEKARDAESKAYREMGKANDLTGRQEGIIELAGMQEIEAPDDEQMDRKFRLILESYYLPHILRDGFKVRLNEEFTRFEEPERDYIEAVFTGPSGKEKSVGYNYKTDDDGKSLIIFEKAFQNVVLEPGDPEKYVIYDEDGHTESESFSLEELKEKVLAGDIVKVENDYFLKAKDADGNILEGKTIPIVEDEGQNNVKLIIGDNEQKKYSFNKEGNLVCATTNDVTTVKVETRHFASEGPVYDSEEAAKAAAEKELKEGETNLRITTSMEGTTVADFNFLSVYTTSVDIKGIIKKLGKGVEGYDQSISDEDNLKTYFTTLINQYLNEKGFHVIDISCDGFKSDVKENAGWMNVIKTYQMTEGIISVTYIKKFSAVVNLKQGFLGRGQNNDISVILAQLPEGSEVLNPQDIDWKNSRPQVEYVARTDTTGIASAKTIEEADKLAVQNAILAAQKIAVKGLNGGISSGIREIISANGDVSTVANVRAKLNTASVIKSDMRLTHKDEKFAYSGSCDSMSSSVENKLVKVTTWDGNKLTYVPPTDPVIDRGIPSDKNYDKYVSEGDDSGILIFENSDRGLRRYIEEVLDARTQAQRTRAAYDKARGELREAQENFDRIYDLRMERFSRLDESDDIEESLESISRETDETPEDMHDISQDIEEPDEAPEDMYDISHDTDEADETPEDVHDISQDTEETDEIQEDMHDISQDIKETDADVAQESGESEEETESMELPESDKQMTAREALLEIFGE